MVKQVISFHYTLKDKTGKVIDSSQGREPISFLEGVGQIIPGLETEMLVLKTGDKQNINVPYQKAYGKYDQALINKTARSNFPPGEIKPGDMFEVTHNDKNYLATVIEINETEVVLDGNHPLAGQDLNFQIEITDRRDATADEIIHGHAHGPHGHHHH